MGGSTGGYPDLPAPPELRPREVPPSLRRIFPPIPQEAPPATPELVTVGQAEIPPGPERAPASSKGDRTMDAGPVLRLAREAARTLRVSRVGVWTFSPGGTLAALARYDRRLGAVLEGGALTDELSRHFLALLERVASLAVPDTERASDGDPLRAWVRDEEVRAILLLPLRIENRIAGMITCEETGGPRSWTPRDRDIASALTHQIREALGSFPALNRTSDLEREAPAPVLASAAAVPAPPADEVAASQDEVVSSLDDSGQPGWISLPQEAERSPGLEAQGDVRSVESSGVELSRVEPSRADRPRGDTFPGMSLHLDRSAVGIDEVRDRIAERTTSEARGEESVRTEMRGEERARIEMPGEERVRTEIRSEESGGSRRLSPLESGALLAGEEADAVLWGLEVQMAYLRLLEEMLTDRPEELGFLREALEIGEGVTQGARSAVLLLRQGLPTGSPIDLGAFLASMIPQLASEAGREVRLRIAPGSEPLPIRGQSESLDRAFRYLIREARLTTPVSDRVRISWGRVSPAGSAGRNAKGFLASEVARIRFTYRGKVETRPISGPLFVDAVIEAHGGWVERGKRGAEETVVDLYLPLSLPVLSRPQDATERETGARRILLVEEEPLLARLVERTLLRSGYLVDVAASRMEAERIWRHGEGAFDLLVADRELIGGDSGLDVVQSLGAEASNLPLLLLDRGSTFGGSAAKSATDSSVETLRRPFEAADILRAVRNALTPSLAQGGPLSSSGGFPTTFPGSQSEKAH